MESLLTYVREHNLSHAQFGELIGVDRSYVTRILNGDKKPSLETLRKLHRVTKVPLAKLLDEAIDS